MTAPRWFNGADELRSIVKFCNNTREGALDGLSVEETIRLSRAIMACGWDVTAEDLTPDERAFAARTGKMKASFARRMETGT